MKNFVAVVLELGLQKWTLYYAECCDKYESGLVWFSNPRLRYTP
jgi:hypothetical protein